MPEPTPSTRAGGGRADGGPPSSPTRTTRRSPIPRHVPERQHRQQQHGRGRGGSGTERAVCRASPHHQLDVLRPREQKLKIATKNTTMAALVRRSGRRTAGYVEQQVGRRSSLRTLHNSTPVISSRRPAGRSSRRPAPRGYRTSNTATAAATTPHPANRSVWIPGSLLVAMLRPTAASRPRRQESLEDRLPGPEVA